MKAGALHVTRKSSGARDNPPRSPAGCRARLCSLPTFSRENSSVTLVRLKIGEILRVFRWGVGAINAKSEPLRVTLFLDLPPLGAPLFGYPPLGTLLVCCHRRASG